MNERSELERLLGRLATESPRHADASSEARVLAAFRAHQKRWRRPLVYWVIAAACVALAIVSIRTHRTAPHTPPAISVAGLTSGFIALPYAQSDVPLEQAVIVRVELQSAAWGALNVPVSGPAAGAVVRADLLVGQDGVARAVRVVSIQ
jgi:hypothetical protein